MRDHRQRRLGIFIIYGVINCTHIQRIVHQLAAHGEQQRHRLRFVLHGGQVESGITVFVGLVQQVGVDRMEKLYRACVSVHGGQV